MTEEKTIFVERDTYEKDGNTYYGSLPSVGQGAAQYVAPVRAAKGF